MDDASQIVPVLRYKDVEQAAGWLCRAFRFRRRRVVKDEAGDISYILLTCGRSTLLIRPVSNTEFDDLMVQPENAGTASTQVCYLAVSDLDAHCRRADTAGARIELAPGSDGFGGGFYTCRDLDGHLWSFGTQDYRVAPRFVSRLRAGSRRASQWASVVTVAALAAGAWAFHDGHQGQSRPLAMTPASMASVSGDAAWDMSRSLKSTAAELDRAREENARLTVEVASVRSHERQQRTLWQHTGAELAVLQARLTSERKARDAAVAEAVRSEQAVKTLRADVEQQMQQRAALQEQLQAAMAALLDAGQEAAPVHMRPSSIQMRAIAAPRAARPVRARPAEAIACYRQLMRGRVSWGGGAGWLPPNAYALCSGTRNARRTISCFEAGIRAGQPWREAVNACRAT
ncbi:MAG: VOC family protein [Hyphomicrobiaceae bacterium]